MSAQQHTPAPWSIHGQEFIVSQKGLTIAHVWEDDFDHDRDPEAERDANAHLIAAAPEMKAALIKVVDALFAKDLKHGMEDEIETARLSIAKAEGR